MSAPKESTVEFSIPEWMRQSLRVRGVGRVADEPRALLVMFTDVPTDDELRKFHEYIRGTVYGWRESENV